jgi:hypothetical protein
MTTSADNSKDEPSSSEDDENNFLPTKSPLKYYESILIPNTGELGRYSTNDQHSSTREIGGGYAKRQEVNNDTRSIGGVLNILGLFSGAMDFASAALSSLPAAVSGYIVHRVTFKNDADIIIIPSEVVMPGQHWCRSSPTMLFPGETCTALIVYPKRMENFNAEMSFSFGAISTDRNIAPSDTPMTLDGARVFHFKIFIGRNTGRILLLRVHGIQHNTDTSFSLATQAQSSGAHRMHYIGFRGLGSTTSPSFGIAAMDTGITSTEGKAMSFQITFTPLDWRS